MAPFKNNDTTKFPGTSWYHPNTHINQLWTCATPCPPADAGLALRASNSGFETLRRLPNRNGRLRAARAQSPNGPFGPVPPVLSGLRAGWNRTLTAWPEPTSYRSRCGSAPGGPPVIRYRNRPPVLVVNLYPVASQTFRS